MASALQTSLQMPQPIDLLLSIVANRGTACGYLMYEALRFAILSLYSSVASTGHFLAQSPQPVHFSGSTLLAFLRRTAVKSPSSPLRSTRSVYVRSSTLGCLPAPTSLGARMHMAQSLVGNVLSSWVMTPPMVGSLSMR